MRRLSPSVPVLVTAVALSGAAVLPLSAALAAPVAAQDTFIPGSGTSSASIARITLRSSGLGIGVGFGQARTRYAGQQGNASANNVDLGLFNTLSKAPVACGMALGSMFPEGTAPEGVAVSSGDGPAEQSTASVGQDSPIQLGSQYGSAKPGSEADATVDGAKIDLQGIVTAIGGTATSTAKLTPGKQRSATADSSMGSLSLAGGAVVLEGLHWTAAHRTGAEADAAGAFTIGSMRIAGQYYPTSGPEDMQTALDQANAVLAPTGLSLHAPKVQKTADAVTVTPMRLTVSSTKEMRAALGPALEAVQPLRSQLLELLEPFQASPDCGLAKGLGFGYLVADLALVVLGDNGGIDLDFGGVRAGTEFATYDNPFGSGYGLITPGESLPGTPAVPDLGAAPGTGPLVPGAVPAGQTPTTSLQPATGQVVPVALGCRSTHEDGGGCAAHRGALAGWLIFALIVALAGADRIRARMN
jgi:hypothetical protein